MSTNQQQAELYRRLSDKQTIAYYEDKAKALDAELTVKQIELSELEAELQKEIIKKNGLGWLDAEVITIRFTVYIPTHLHKIQKRCASHDLSVNDTAESRFATQKEEEILNDIEELRREIIIFTRKRELHDQAAAALRKNRGSAIQLATIFSKKADSENVDANGTSTAPQPGAPR